MSLVATCQCGAQFAAQFHLAGKIVACPNCGGNIQVPATPAMTPAAAPSPVATPQYDPLASAGTHESTLGGVGTTSAKPRLSRSDKRLMIFGGVGIGVLLLLAGVVFAVVQAVQLARNKPPSAPVVEELATKTNELASTANDKVAEVPTEEVGDVPATTDSEPVAPIELVPLGALPSFSKVDAAAPKPTLNYNWSRKRPLIYAFSVESAASKSSVLINAYGTTSYTPTDIAPSAAGLKVQGDVLSKGTGFVVHPDGLLVTCEHVIARAKTITVHVNGQQYPANVVEVDKRNNLALLKIEATGLRYLHVADSNTVELDQEVVVGGFSKTSDANSTMTAKVGRVSSKPRDEMGTLMQFEAPVEKANSGGPLMNKHGQVLGVVNAMFADEELASDAGLAVPSSTLTKILDRLQVPFQRAVVTRETKGVIDEVARAVAYLEVELGGAGLISKDAKVLSVETAMDFYGLSTSARFESDRHTVVDATGTVHYREGQLVLPFFLGESGHIAIESTPKDGRTQWTKSEPIRVPVADAVGQTPSPFDRIKLVRPGGLKPPTRLAKSDIVELPVMRTTTYSIRDPSAEIVEVDREMTVKLLSEAKEFKFDINTRGTYFFDKKLGLNTKGIFRGEIDFHVGSVAIKAPVVESYQLLSSRVGDNVVDSAIRRAYVTKRPDYLVNKQKYNPKHVVRGAVSRSDSTLVTSAEKASQYMFAGATPPACYRLYMDVARSSGDGAFVVGVVANGRHVCNAVFDYKTKSGERRSGLTAIDGVSLGSDDYQGAYTKPIFNSGKEIPISVYVEGSVIELGVGTTSIFKWQGGLARLSVDSFEVPDTKRLSVGSWNSRFRVKSPRLYRVGRDIR